jgi:alkanesulfonate monooxygenase SsuD/methylene tetrahydromethanopterin reductase-like flavin-dependent oxidoreductase (luciferase family)
MMPAQTGTQAVERVGFGTGYEASVGVAEAASLIARAEAAGFQLGFFSEAARLLRDGPSALAAMALATSRIDVGAVQVVRLRSPVVMAQTIATLDELSGGRLMIAPGACSPGAAARHGLPPADPGQTLIEYMESIRLLLTGQRVSYHGEYVRFEDVQLGWTPLRSSVPLLPAATSPRGLRLAGTYGDGVLLDACASPEYSANAIAVLREAHEGAGRDWSQFVVAQIVSCSIEDDRDSALDAVRWEVATKLTPASHRFQRYRIAVGEPRMQVAEFGALRRAFERGGMEGLAHAVPTSWVEGVTASGTPQDVQRRVAEYRAAGVQLPILRPAAAHQVERLLALFGRGAVS